VSTVFASPIEFALVCLVLLVAETVYVLLGFGAGLIAVGGVALFMPEIRDIVVLLLLINLPPELWVVRSSWRQIHWRGVSWIGAGVAAGVPLGTWLLRWGEPTLLLDLLGVVLVGAGGAFLLLPERGLVRWPRGTEPAAGLVSGILAGLFGTGGPPLILYYQLSRVDKTVFRGSLMAIFLLVSLIRLPAYAVAGLLTSERLLSAACVLPVVAVAMVAGHHIHVTVEEMTFRRMVSAALVLIGLVLLVR
jgi:uncharacterized membrane protein YfcA